MFVAVGYASSQLSSEKLLYDVDGYQCRDQQLVKVYKTEDCRMVIPIIALPPRAQEPSWKRGRKSVRAG